MQKVLKSLRSMTNHTKLVFTVIVLMAVVSLFVYGMNSYSGSSLKVKYTSNTELILKLNRSFANLKFTEEEATSATNTDIVSLNTQYKDTVLVLDNTELSQPNIIELMFDFSNARDLTNRNNVYNEKIEELKPELTSLLDKTTTLEKFLLYDANEDFIFLGENTNDDNQRTDMAISAIKLIREDEKLQNEDEILASLDESIKEFEEFKKNNNLTYLSEVITSSQIKIAQQLSARASGLQQNMSDIYSDYIY